MSSTQMIYLRCAGRPDISHVGLCLCDDINAVIAIANVLLKYLVPGHTSQPLRQIIPLRDTC